MSKNAPVELLSDLAFKMQLVNTEVGKQIGKPGQLCRHMYIIFSGKVKITANMDDIEHIVELLPAGSIINPYSFLVEDMIDSNIETIQAC
jgi:CRP-like cAMP-binding protein